jgi:hypothetical protein
MSGTGRSPARRDEADKVHLWAVHNEYADWIFRRSIAERSKAPSRALRDGQIDEPIRQLDEPIRQLDEPIRQLDEPTPPDPVRCSTRRAFVMAHP